MLVDKQMQFSDAQAVTEAAASTDYYDTQAAGDALNAGQDLYINVRVHTTATSGGSATLAIKVQTDDNTSFSSATDLYTSSATAVADLTANKYLVQIPWPKNTERYVRIYYAVATADLTAGKFDAFVSSGIDVKRPVA